MNKRRQFFKIALGVGGSVWLMFSPFAKGLKFAFAEIKKIILPKGTRMDTLIRKNPAELDTRHLEPTPIDRFETMGTDDYRVDIDRWRLELGGSIQNPLKFRYDQILDMPSIRRNVLLICPGFFAYHADWQGISVAKLLQMAQVDSKTTHVTFKGPQAIMEKSQRFPIKDIWNDKVFLAYRVNDKVLPRKHGFPLRVVAEDYYGGDWVKYVYKITVNRG